MVSGWPLGLGTVKALIADVSRAHLLHLFNLVTIGCQRGQGLGCEPLSS